MKLKKILILKNDRVGDLFTSLKLISSLINSNTNIKIFLSEFNYGFKFLLKKINVSKINYKMSIFDKFKIFFEILKYNYDEVYILTPKSFYFFLPMVFRKIKFFAITYNSNKRNRPNYYLRKFLYRYKIIYRNKINIYSYRDLQLQLLDKNTYTIDNLYNNLTYNDFSHSKKKLLPKNYIFFQFRHKFFEKIDWNVKDFQNLLISINTKYQNIIFCSDIEQNNINKFYNNYFESNFNTIDLNNLFCKKCNKDNIFFLKNLGPEDFFNVVKLSDKTIGKEGIITHISFFHGIKCHNLFNFNVQNKQDLLHEKISYSEWYKGMNYKFSIINNNVNKSISKILKIF